MTKSSVGDFFANTDESDFIMPLNSIDQKHKMAHTKLRNTEELSEINIFAGEKKFK